MDVIYRRQLTLRVTAPVRRSTNHAVHLLAEHARCRRVHSHPAPSHVAPSHTYCSSSTTVAGILSILFTEQERSYHSSLPQNRSHWGTVIQPQWLSEWLALRVLVCLQNFIECSVLAPKSAKLHRNTQNACPCRGVHPARGHPACAHTQTTEYERLRERATAAPRSAGSAEYPASLACTARQPSPLRIRH